MQQLPYALPVVAVVVAIGTGWLRSTGAGALGAASSLAVALSYAPVPFGTGEAALAVARGTWQTALVGAVILGGLFFREPAARPDGPEASVTASGPRERMFAACFLVGPFVEASTGFGVGQVTAIAMIAPLGLRPLHVAYLGLFSQTMVSWGAFANGTMIGSQLSGIPAATLGVRSALLNAPSLMGWLGMFWWAARAAGVGAGVPRHMVEAAWTALAAILLVACNRLLGPEVAGLAALGPLVVLNFFAEGRPDRGRVRRAARECLPYIALVMALAAGRAIPAVARALAAAASFSPVAGGAEWQPLVHPASWLLAFGCLAAFASGGLPRVRRSFAAAWERGRRPVLTILLFLIMAQVMVASGSATALASALHDSLGSGAVLATPALAGLMGFLTSSSNASNGLLMPPQAALAAAAGVDLAWLAAIQNTAAASLTMLSPVRLAMGCALTGRPDLERRLYRRAWPLGLIPLVFMTAAAFLIVRHVLP